MKKTILFAMVVLLAVTFSGLALAAQEQAAVPAVGNGFCSHFGQHHDNLTDEQKAQIADWRQERQEQRKQVLAKQVEWGWITQAQADQEISRLEQQSTSGTCGQGMMGMGRHGRACGGLGNR